MNWNKVVTDLQKAGMPIPQQAKEVGVTRKTIDNWSTGVSEPLFSTGTILLDVYRTVCGSTEKL